MERKDDRLAVIVMVLALLALPIAGANIVKHIVKGEPGAGSHRSLLFRRLPTSVSLRVAGCEWRVLGSSPKPPAFMEMRPPPGVRYAAQVLRTVAFSSCPDFPWKHRSPGLFLHPFTHVYFTPLFSLPSSRQSCALVLCTIH